MSDEIHAGGGGSGYIANPNVSNGCMRGYDAQTSSDSGTLTRKATGVSRTAISNQAKIANGFCRITYLGPIPPPPAINYIFHPEMRSDGHDTVRYNPNDIITLDVSGGTGTAGEGCIESTISHYAIENQAFTNEADDFALVLWFYDENQHQNIIPDNADVTISADVQVPDVDSSGFKLSLYGEGLVDPSDLAEVAVFNFMPYNLFYIRETGSSYWGDNFNGWPSGVEANVWYNVKFVIHVASGNVTNISLYLNDEQIGTQTVEAGTTVPMFNTANGRATRLISLESDYGYGGHNYIKNLSIKYD